MVREKVTGVKTGVNVNARRKFEFVVVRAGLAENAVGACGAKRQVVHRGELVAGVMVHADQHPVTNIEGVGLAVTVIATEDSLLGALVGVGDGLIILMEALDEIVGCFVDGITSGWWLGKVRQPSRVVAVGKEGWGEFGIRNGRVVDGELDVGHNVVPVFALCHCEYEGVVQRSGWYAP